MAKLIGTDPNQVPSNADLGSAAFMDKKEFLLSKGSNLSAINAVIPKTAVDVFIYDTTKDSDGGAWRKRTQDTSWYNERLNTTTRGSRKEFPVVAVIVSDSVANSITIYDADDPTLPMWMEFIQGSTGMANKYLVQGNGYDHSVYMLNGILATGYNNEASSYGQPIINFISEKIVRMDQQADGNEGGTYTGNIATRNDSTYGYVSSDEDYDIVNGAVNDVAMTVLPNAPIDADTGLPVPTIAVATDGGYSIIKDDGSVVDGTCSQLNHQKVEKIVFTQDNMLFYGGFDYNLQDRSRLYRVDNILSSDTVLSTSNSDPQNSAEVYGFTTTIAANDKTLVVDVAEGATNDYLSDPHLAFSDNELRFANLNGLYKVARNKALPSAGLANKITSSYNTGWMHGDIKLATLSDTDATNVTGSELVTNGTFDSNISGWTNADASSFTHDAGEARITSSSGWQTVYQAITTVVGKRYVITADVTANSNIVDLWIGTAGTGALANRYALGGNSNITGTGPMSASITATGTTTYVHLAVYNGTADFDNVTARLAEEDRSVNGNGLQVFGTVTKTAVATGADLMGYSGFTTSNYLQQPYSSDLDFGTGDVSAMGWFKFESTYVGTKIFFDRADPSWPSAGSGQRIFFGLNGNDYLYYYTDTGNTTTSTVVPSNVWTHACFVRSGTSHKIYMNGALVVSNTHTASNLSGSTNVLTVGNGTPSKANPWPGTLALWRISATAPSSEQIKKIYEDEKFLFQENAKATLYGSSDAVTALAYDDDTELLHAGTSAGRSDFQGLRRINNTTRAISTAISAVDGFIVEE